MNKKVRIFVFATISVCLLSLGFFITEKQFNSNAESPAFWITVDESELRHVQSVIQQKGGKFDLELIESRGGLAIIKSDELQILDLTRSMHDEFHKCAGFMAHESYEKASESINETLRADVNANLVDYTINNQANVNQLLPEAQEINVRNTINVLSAFPNRRYNQQSGLDSAQRIKSDWTTLANGRSDITIEQINHPTGTSPQPSIILTIQGTTFPNEVVVIGGHQDSINSSGSTAAAPGADDDASGIASLTEAMRVIITKNFRPQRTVKFMAYAAEEVGLRGSNAIATDFQTRGVNVVGVMQLDMTNFKPATSNFDFVKKYIFAKFDYNLFADNDLYNFSLWLRLF